MAQIMLKILTTMLTQLLTETFLGHTIVICLNKLSKSTTNSLDDAIVLEIAKALGCSDLITK